MSKLQFGQGMTEYIIIVALIAIAAIGTFRYFGNTARQQVAAMSQELSGQDGTQEINAAKHAAGKAKSNAGNKTLGTYGGQSK